MPKSKAPKKSARSVRSLSRLIKEPIKVTVRIPVQLYIDIQNMAEADHRSVSKEIVYLAELGIAAVSGKHIEVVHAGDEASVEEGSSAIGFKLDEE